MTITAYGEAQSFFRETVLPFTGDECLIWPYVRGGAGYYGQLRRDGRMQHVHRLACEAIYGPPPTSKHEAAHNCGKGRTGCVNPRHVRWATPAENHADMAVHGTIAYGGRNCAAKLTESDVLKIRSLRGKMFQREIAERFGVSSEHISRIQSGERWGWFKKPAPPKDSA